MTVLVTGDLVARPEAFERLLEAALAHVARSRAEDGCIQHGVAVDAENPLRLVFFEIWRDAAALKTHFAQPGSAEFMEAVAAFAVGRGGLEIYSAERVKV